MAYARPPLMDARPVSSAPGRASETHALSALAAVIAAATLGVVLVPAVWASDGSRDLQFLVLAPTLLAAWFGVLGLHLRAQVRHRLDHPRQDDAVQADAELLRRSHQPQSLQRLHRALRTMLLYVFDEPLRMPTWMLVMSLVLVGSTLASAVLVLSRALTIHGTLEQGVVRLHLGWKATHAMTFKIAWDVLSRRRPQQEGGAAVDSIGAGADIGAGAGIGAGADIGNYDA